MDEPSLTVRESEMSSGRIVELTLRDSLDSGGGGDLVNLHPRTRRKMMRTVSPESGWSCIFCWSCSEPCDGGTCLSIGSVEADPKGYPRLPTSRRPRGRGPWWANQ